jgi:hypothetical protein
MCFLLLICSLDVISTTCTTLEALIENPLLSKTNFHAYDVLSLPLIYSISNIVLRLFVSFYFVYSMKNTIKPHTRNPIRNEINTALSPYNVSSSLIILGAIYPITQNVANMMLSVVSVVLLIANYLVLIYIITSLHYVIVRNEFNILTLPYSL